MNTLQEKRLDDGIGIGLFISTEIAKFIGNHFKLYIIKGPLDGIEICTEEGVGTRVGLLVYICERQFLQKDPEIQRMFKHEFHKHGMKLDIPH